MSADDRRSAATYYYRFDIDDATDAHTRRLVETLDYAADEKGTGVRRIDQVTVDDDGREVTTSYHFAIAGSPAPYSLESLALGARPRASWRIRLGLAARRQRVDPPKLALRLFAAGDAEHYSREWRAHLSELVAGGQCREARRHRRRLALRAPRLALELRVRALLRRPLQRSR
jgi:hypothetical protein